MEEVLTAPPELSYDLGHRLAEERRAAFREHAQDALLFSCEQVGVRVRAGPRHPPFGVEATLGRAGRGERLAKFTTSFSALF